MKVIHIFLDLVFKTCITPLITHNLILHINISYLNKRRVGQLCKNVPLFPPNNYKLLNGDFTLYIYLNQDFINSRLVGSN